MREFESRSGQYCYSEGLEFFFDFSEKTYLALIYLPELTALTKASFHRL